MFTKVLYPTDFSEDAEKAISYIEQLAAAGVQEVIVLHVIEDFGLEKIMESCRKAGFEEEEFKEDVLGSFIAEPQKKAKAICQRFQDAGIGASVRIEFGKAHRVISRLAEEEGVSLIVMGAQGKGKIESMVMGSVSEGTLRLSRVPVFVVRGDTD